ncbi:MAG: hypothetical protein M1823_001555 [Watsoniomyces obsoletus]|nr:MAG: hypothetical protein M1823_001555 [Watsoniomyces obsoletus]
MSDMDTTHRKIELQSLDDLSYLITNVQKTAREILDSHIPLSSSTSNPSTGGGGGASNTHEHGHSTRRANNNNNNTKEDANTNEDDEKRRKEVEEIVNGNGKEQPHEQDNYEPYDAHLATRLQTLYSTLESETLALAELRRTAPLEAAETIRLELEREREAHHSPPLLLPSTSVITPTSESLGMPGTSKSRNRDAVVEDKEMTLKNESKDDEGDDMKMSNDDDEEGIEDAKLEVLKDIPRERRQDMERNWGRALEELMRLKSTLPGTTAKLERAKTVVEYLESQSQCK